MSKPWSARKKLCFAFFASVGLWAGVVYIAGQWWPWYTKGEGAKEDNYPW